MGNYPYNNPNRSDFRNAGYDYLLATSDHVADKAHQYYKGLGDCMLKIVVGYPKLDTAVNSGLNRNAVLKKLGFSPDKKTLLFATHWSRYSLIKTFDMDLLKALVKQNTYNIIVSGHKYLWDTEEDWLTQNIDWRRRLAQFEGHENLCVADNMGYSELMVASDILLSDHNSLVVEFSAMNKPILFYDKSSAEINDKNLCRLVRNASGVFCSVQTAMDLLKSIQEEPGSESSRLSQARSDLAGYCFANIGTATLVAARVMVEICRKERGR
jgi:CDP-glycerol glycerophosphotransferase (TagB/SpsB family)